MTSEPSFFESAQSPLSEESAKLPFHREQLFQLLVTSVRDYAIFMLDPQGKIVTWNEGAQRANGYTAEEAIGRHFSIFYTPEAIASNHPQHELDVATKVGRYEEEGWRVRKDGTIFWASVVITALYSDGKLIGFAKVTRDLSERKRVEEERDANERLLQQTNEELQRLAYVVSHELQAPIATILRYSNLLTVRYKDRLGDDANEFIEKIIDGSKLIARMIDDLWTYARVSRPGSALEAVSLNNALQDSLKELESEIAEDEIRYSANLPTVLGNRGQLVYLFKELISNSVKYRGSEPPRVIIDWKRERDGFVVSVADNGVGIDPIFASEAFKIFHRIQGAPDTTGTGMGLAICRKIMQQHKGRIWFDSTVGTGTTVHLFFPNSVTA